MSDDCCGVPQDLYRWPVLSRRALLTGAVTGAVTGVLSGLVGAPAAGATSPGNAPSSANAAPALVPLGRHGLLVHPRTVWGAALKPKAAMTVEPDVHTLIVHHTVTPNTYTAADVPRSLRNIHAFHTGEKGWPDIAYSFFVDRFGGVWEGRTGSLTSPVAGSATGGNQGSSRLCCLLGDFGATPPPAAMVDSLVKLLATLADVHGLETAPGTQASFRSRGSNKWAAGTAVRVPTICGHRQVSQTTCPGDAAYALIPKDIPARVTALRAR